jgi:predicted metal-binding membrane protein
VRLAAALLAEARQGPWPPLILASLTGWLGLLALDRRFPFSSLCSATTLPPSIAWWALSLLAMATAMMAPLLKEPMQHLWSRSLARRRGRAIAAFVLAYGGCWMAAMAVLALAAIGSRMAREPLPITSAIGLAVLWQCSPVKQHCLNRCHRLPRLAAFGWRADRDCLRYGLAHAGWCVGSCWALMLLGMLVDGAGMALAMAITTLLLIERWERPRPARWRPARWRPARWRLPGYPPPRPLLARPSRSSSVASAAPTPSGLRM